MKKNRRLKTTALFLVMAILLTGCQNDKVIEESKKENVTELKAVILGVEPKKGMDKLYESLDELTEKELGCRVRFSFIPWGNEREQLNIVVASGEYDIIPNGTFSDYKKLIGKNAFLDLSEYLDEVPLLTEHYNVEGTDYLEDCYIDGALYGIPQFNDAELLYDSEGFFYRKDLLEKWGLEEIHDIDSMEKYLYRAAKEEEYAGKPLITDNRIWQSLWIMLGDEKYVEVSSMQETPFIVLDTTTGEIVSRLETPEFRQVLGYIKKWAKDGILASDMLSMSDNEGTRGINLMNEDLKPCETNVPIWSIDSNAIRILSENHPEWEYDFFTYLTSKKSYFVNSLSNASVVSISAKSAHPELALKFIEKVHTDNRYYDLMQYGALDINYRLVDGKVSFQNIGSENRFCYSIFGDCFLNREMVPVNEQFYNDAVLEHDTWAKEALMHAKKNPAASETADLSYFQNSKTIDKIQLEYFQPLVCGYYSDVDKRLNELIELLNE
ncbi:MAG: extracellular solute-binding protein [Butyrivibrio sp.]|nr:extracellular solute-binding protein [Butyrivibrio sp.]